MRKSLFLFCFIAAVAAYPAGLRAQDAEAEPAPVTNCDSIFSCPSLLSNNLNSLGGGTRPLTAFAEIIPNSVEPVAAAATNIIGLIGEIGVQRRTYTPPIDLTEVLSAQY